MENNIYISSLYDIYGVLLTDTQQKYFEDYYFNNYSLSEISENYCVTRNAVHKSLKESLEKLNNYESKLKLKEKIETIKKLNIDEKTKDKIIDIFE